ncbi:site-specific integrase [Tamlana sp. s12]|uniref:tyrosine-type recombinase/integrase n=1 Tax=Tamlana sp. s12 TaxID=1630406 RepID=UPI0007FDAF81|nr:site-specific integrase [Tamlana sp. s12]OBQ52863.1 hypothetical protein VQ01_13020 [Tamlana sp. s12]QQY81111.1 site-specific integrase [Tamlana sp. s12]
MKELKNAQSNSSKLFVDYIPAELRENKDWLIVYSIINPITKKLVRKRKRIPPHTSISERRKMARKMVASINSRLERGWNEIIEDDAPKALSLIKDATNNYINSLDRDYHSGTIRKDTYRTYSSYISLFNNWLIATGRDKEFVINFNATLVSEFLDYVYIERKNKARTYNNYLHALRLFNKYMILKGYKNIDVTVVFQTKKNSEKVRGLIEVDEIKNVFAYLDKNYVELSLVCKLIYYCYIRPTELSKLQVKDVLIKDRLIHLSRQNSKKTSGYLTVQTELMQQLALHIRNAKLDDYLFSRNECKTGKIQASGRMYYDRWMKHIVKNKITENPLYSLKDSGITFALDNGVSPVSVMNQARHHDLSITTAYLRRPQRKADENILTASW